MVTTNMEISRDFINKNEPSQFAPLTIIEGPRRVSDNLIDDISCLGGFFPFIGAHLSNVDFVSGFVDMVDFLDLVAVLVEPDLL